MKIKVNKQAQSKKLIDTRNVVVLIAKDCAERGINRFNHAYPKGYGFDAHQLIKEVEEYTEDSVYAGHKSVSNGTIKFSIR